MKPPKPVAHRPSFRGDLQQGGRRYRRHEQGLALVMTLFVVALVTVLVLEYHFDASVEIDLAMNYASDVQAYYLALAGVHFAQALLQQAPKDTNGLEDAWSKVGLVPACFSPQQLLALATTGLGDGVPIESTDVKTAGAPPMTDQRLEDMGQGGTGCVSLLITDENRKLPINALRPLNGDENQPLPAVWVSIFRRFFESFQIDSDVVEALIDWLDTGDNPRGNGAEKSYYQSLPIPYAPPNRPMRTPGELRLVKGLNEAETLAKLFPGALPEAVAELDLGRNPYLTPFGAEQMQAVPPAGSSTAKVNVNTAAPEILRALIAGVQTGTSGVEGIVEEIVARRQEKKLTQQELLQAAGTLRTALGGVADVKSTHFRIESVGVVGIVQKKIVVVLKRDTQSVNQANPATRAQQMTMLYFKVE